MGSVRVHVVIPEELARDIDALAGKRGRSAFLVETAEQEVRRRKLLAFLDRKEPAWRAEDHPEIAEQGSAAWVHKLRQTKSSRQERIEQAGKRKEK